MSSPLPATSSPNAVRDFLSGVRAALSSVFSLVLTGSYVGIGALAHDFGFSAGWVAASTLLVWAAPAQVILVTTLGAGATLIEAAVATTLSAVRLLPMVVALLPLLKHERTRQHQLLLPAHFTAISMWVESLRLLPQVPRESRLWWCNGIGAGFMAVATGAGVAGFYLAGGLPLPLAAMLLFLTPLSFLISVIRNSRYLVDRLAFAIGFVVGPLVIWSKLELALMWIGLIGGTLAYIIARVVARKGRSA